MSTFGVLDVAVSIDKFANDFIAKMVTDGVSPGLTYYDFDSRNDIANLPNVDLFGPNGFAFDEEPGGMMQIMTAFVSATVDDRNGYRHNRIIHELHQLVRPGRRIDMFDHATGSKITALTVAHLSLAPVNRSEVRAMQAVALTLVPGFVSA